MQPLLQNLALSLGNNEEVCYCLKAWQELPSSVRNGGRPNKDEALLAVAVISRIRRAISEVRMLRMRVCACACVCMRVGACVWVCMHNKHKRNKPSMRHLKHIVCSSLRLSRQRLCGMK